MVDVIYSEIKNMSDNKVSLLDFKQFGEYLNTLSGDHVCPMCGEDEWTLYTPYELTKDEDSSAVKRVIPSIPLVSYITDEEKKRATLVNSEALDILMMQCSNCGYINLFSHRKVTKNIKSGTYKKIGSEESESDESSEF